MPSISLIIPDEIAFEMRFFRILCMKKPMVVCYVLNGFQLLCVMQRLVLAVMHIVKRAVKRDITINSH